jgi:ribulose-5-phosphate 4-epimerase/fuculose-1-phosphate aldolase
MTPSTELHAQAVAQARADIVRIGRSLFERRLVHSSAGNISVRLPGDAGFLITPGDACLGFLDPDQLAWVDGDGVLVSGERPSKTLTLHRRIYAADTEANCVLHTHSTHLVALSLLGVWSESDILPPLTAYQVMKVGHVPLIAWRRPGDPEVADLVAEQIGAASAAGKPIRAVMLDRLGPMVWQRSAADAMATLDELEESARLWLLSGRAVLPLNEAQIEEIRRAFGASW